MKRVVVLTGAGISAESGISTFRDHNGLWKTHRFEDLATPEAWERNPQLVLDFYNMRRKQLFEVEPNQAHRALAGLEKHFQVFIITQNVDDLHERAGSTHVLHLHGELKKARSTGNPELVTEMNHWELKWGDKAADGHQLRPHIVWFGEAVPNMGDAIRLVKKADIFLVVGTSLQVYPAAGLLDYALPGIPFYLIDPQAASPKNLPHIKVLRENATSGVPLAASEIIHLYTHS